MTSSHSTDSSSLETFHFSFSFGSDSGRKLTSDSQYSMPTCLRNVDASFFRFAPLMYYSHQCPCHMHHPTFQHHSSSRSCHRRLLPRNLPWFLLHIFRYCIFWVLGSSTPSISILESTKYMWKDVAQNMDRDKALSLVYGTLSAFMIAVKTLEKSVLRLTYWGNMMSGIFLVRYFSHFLLQDSMLQSPHLIHSCHASFSMVKSPSSWRKSSLHHQIWLGPMKFTNVLLNEALSLSVPSSQDSSVSHSV